MQLGKKSHRNCMILEHRNQHARQTYFIILILLKASRLKFYRI